jgi:hypothetical protein
LKGENEKKNQFNKRSKKIKQLKRWGLNWKKITYHNLRLKDEIENKLKFYKGTKKKN